MSAGAAAAATAAYTITESWLSSSCPMLKRCDKVQSTASVAAMY
jgi:uncharacterized protein (DUF697 family)